MTEIRYLVCPMCGMSRVMHKTGSVAVREGKYRGPKPDPRFDIVDPKTAPFIDIRVAERRSIRRIDFLTIREAVEEYREYVEQVRGQAERILREAEDALKEEGKAEAEGEERTEGEE